MTNKHSLLCSNIFLISLLLISLASSETPKRPSEWATPLKLEGVGNLHKITDNLYRSAQPTKAGMKNLEKLGIKTVIDLRAFHSDAQQVKGTAILDKELSMKTWHIEDEDVIKVLRILHKRENGPFLIHCLHGSDRTGVICAMYRIVEQGWTKEQALDEMVNGGYGFHSIWTNITAYVKNVDVDKIKREAAK
jgi:protein tyrosine/serine phosphatase